MKNDLKRHRLLKILSIKTLRFNSDELQQNEAMGISFEEIMTKMKCDKLKLNLIAAELYLNKEIGYHDALDVTGMYCDDKGLTAFSNNKYKARYWKDFWNNLFTISQIIVPILALIITLVTIIMSQQNKEHIEEVLLLRKQLNTQQELLNSQTNRIQNLYETISLSDSLQKK